MSEIHSFPKVYNLGHPAITDLFDGPTEVTEKVDGSQFSFMKDGEGTVHFRSKSSIIYADSAPALFKPAVETVLSIQDDLVVGWFYRGEAFQKPKHNALAYDRVPDGHIALFGVETANQCYLTYSNMADEATRLGLEAVPLLGYAWVPKPWSMEDLDRWLEQDSFLGGQKVEGVVIKNYTRFGKDGKALMGKYVSEKFKEVHRKNWRADNPNHADILQVIGATLRTEARWEKALIHLRERGELTDSPKDIGPLMKAVSQDVHDEEIDYIKEKLFQWAWKKRLSRHVTAGLPDWYKRRLAEQQFAEENAA